MRALTLLAVTCALAPALSGAAATAKTEPPRLSAADKAAIASCRRRALAAKGLKPTTRRQLLALCAKARASDADAVEGSPREVCERIVLSTSLATTDAARKAEAQKKCATLSGKASA